MAGADENRIFEAVADCTRSKARKTMYGSGVVGPAIVSQLAVWRNATVVRL
jgi:hypothetical protein